MGSFLLEDICQVSVLGDKCHMHVVFSAMMMVVDQLLQLCGGIISVFPA